MAGIKCKTLSLYGQLFQQYSLQSIYPTKGNCIRLQQTFPVGCPRGVMVKAMDSGIVVREFVLQSRYYVHFRANTLGKGMNPLILPAMG